MDPLKFKIEIKDEATTKIDEVIKKLEKLQSTNYSIHLNADSSSLNGAIQAMERMGEHMGAVQEKMKGFEKTPTFDRLFESLDKVEKKFSDYVGKLDPGKGINAKALSGVLEAPIKEMNARLGDAFKESATLSASGLEELQKQLQTRMSKIKAVLDEAITGKMMTENFGIVKVINDVTSKINSQLNPDAIIKNPFAGVVADSVAVSGAITSAFESVKASLLELRSEVAKSGFDHLTTTADKAEAAMLKLNDAFQKLHVTIGSNQDLKNFLTGLGEVISHVRRILPEESDGRVPGIDKMRLNLKKNSEEIEAYIQKIQEKITGLQAAKATGSALGMPASEMLKIDAQIHQFTDLMARLRELRSDSTLISQSGAIGTIITPKYFQMQMQMCDSLIKKAGEFEVYAKRAASGREALAEMRSHISEVIAANNNGRGGEWVTALTRDLQRANVALVDVERKIKELENQGDMKGASKVLGQGWDTEYQKLIKDSLTLIENTKAYQNMLNGIEGLLNNIASVLNRSRGISGIDTTKGLESQITLEGFRDKLLNLNSAELSNQQVMQALVAEYAKLERQANSAANAQDRLNRTQTAKNTAKDEKEAKDLARDMNKAYVESAKLAEKVKDLEGILDKIRSHNASSQFGFIVNPAELEASINKLRQYQLELANFAATGNNPMTGKQRAQMEVDIIGIDAQAKKSKNELTDATKKEAEAQREANKAKHEASSATEKLTQNQLKLVEAIKAATGASQHQNQVLSDLKSMAMQYMSVYAIYGFGKEMANITGELELQKKSLEVVLGNASMASQMYGQIRDLSQMSPFTFMDLMKSTRQLAAFGIETKDLYATMKSLSDIGAGLNVDVNRLILAYGHTRSYGYLSGIQNRQFENAGIDMIGGLADRYNKAADAAKRLGQEAQYVSRRDIFKKMRDKSIPFEDVEAVIMDLDKPGGKFYNMQMRQFDTLGGKLRNLANNYNIMMSELGQKHRGVLMGMVEAITEVHEHWYRYERLIYGVIVALGVMKTAQLAAGRAALATSAQLAAKARDISVNRATTAYLNGAGFFGRPLAGAEAYNRSSNAYRNGVIAIGRDQDVSAYTKQRIALTGKLTQAQRAYLLMQSGVNGVQARSIAQMGVMKRQLMALGMGFQQAAISAGRFVGSLLMNPMTWIMAAVAGITAWIQKAREAGNQAENIRNAIGDAMQTDIKGIQEALDGYKDIFDESVSLLKDGGGITKSKVTLRPDAFSDRDAADVIEDLRKKLEAQSPLYAHDLFDIMRFEDQAKQVEAIVQKLRDIETVKRLEDLDKDNFERTLADTGGWFNEGVIRNMTDYNDAIKNLAFPENTWDKLTEFGKAKVEEYVNNLGISRDEALKRLIASGDFSIETLFNDNNLNFGGLKSKVLDVTDSFKTMFNDMKQPAKETAALIANLDPSMQRNLVEDRLNQMFAEAKIGDEATRTVLSEKFMILVAGALQDSGKNADALIKTYMMSLLSEQVIQNINNSVNSKTNAESLPKIIDQQIENAKRTVSKKNRGLAKYIETTTKYGYDMLRNVANNEAKKLTISLDWQRRAQDLYKISVTPSIDVDYTEFWNKQRKAIKDIQEKFNSAAKQRIKAKLGMDIQLDLNTKSFEAAIKQLKDLYNALGKKNAEIMKDATLSTAEKNKRILANRGLREDLKSYWEPLEDALKKGKGLDAEGLSWDDPTKNKNKNQGNQRDEEYDKWKRRLDYIKQAYQAYKKWKEEVGDDDNKAMKLVMSRFGKYLSKEDINNLKDYQELLKKVKAEIEADTKFKNPENKKSMLASLETMQSDTELNELKDNSQKYESEVKKMLDNLIDMYSNYREILDATGSADIASSILGTDLQWKNKVDFIQGAIDDVLREAGIYGKVTIGPNSDDKAIKSSVQMAVDSVSENGDLNQKYAEQIDAVVAALIKLRDVQKDTLKDAMKQYSEMMKSLTGMASQVARINKEYEDAVEAAKLITDPEQSAQMNRIATKTRDTRLMELSTAFYDFKNNPLIESIEEANTAYEKAAQQYRENFEAGMYSADEYSRKIKELNDAMNAINTAKVQEWILFLEGGGKAVRSQRIETLAQEARSLRKAEEDARSAGHTRIATALAKQALAKEKELREAQDDDANAANFERAINASIKGLQDFVSALNLINGIVDNLGLGDTKYGKNLKFASSAGSSMISGAQALSFLGPYGQVAGAALGLTSAVLQVHDKNLEERINDLREDVAKIESYTETIKNARERTLGYGANTAMMRNFWDTTSNKRTRDINIAGWETTGTFNSAGVKAMREYYASIASGSSVYNAEYDLLLQKREKYLEMYDTENDKKNKSEEQLEEYKKQIAELDSQIAYFAEDVAKELWGIDVKSWADQLSDALASAWENGTSMAVAYGDTVREILQSVGKEMLSLGIIQPMMESLRTGLFGDENTKGVFDINDVEGSMPKVMDYIGKFFGEGGMGNQTITATEEFMEGWEAMLNQLGLSAKNMSGSSLSSGIQGMSESTADLLGGYMNAMRQDVSVIRILQQDFLTNYWNEYYASCTNAHRSIANIEQDVAIMRRVQGDIYTTLDNFYSRFTKVTQGTEFIYVK